MLFRAYLHYAGACTIPPCFFSVMPKLIIFASTSGLYMYNNNICNIKGQPFAKAAFIRELKSYRASRLDIFIPLTLL